MNKKIIEFFTTSCTPCKRMEPVLNEASKTVTVERVDVEQNPNAAKVYDIYSVPTVIFMVDDKPVDRISGAGESAYAKIREFAKG